MPSISAASRCFKPRFSMMLLIFLASSAFKADYPISQCFLIYGGDHREKHGDVLALPIQEALMDLPEILQAKATNPQTPSAATPHTPPPPQS